MIQGDLGSRNNSLSIDSILQELENKIPGITKMKDVQEALKNILGSETSTGQNEATSGGEEPKTENNSGGEAAVQEKTNN